MSLTTGLSIARSALFAAGDQTAVVSRNVANAGNPLFSRKSANVVTAPGGGVRVASVTRASEPALVRRLLAATSDASSQKALVDALDELEQTINDPELDASPAARLAKLSDAIQNYAAQPQSDLAGQAAVRAAGDLVRALNSATETVNRVRRQADADIASSVDRIATLLARFEVVNGQIVNGTRAGSDVTDLLDTRDQIVASMSEEVGVRTIIRADDDMAIYTDSGVPLFDRTARAITFGATLSLAPGALGNAVYADGVPVTGSGATMPIASGRLKGLTAVRDEATVLYQYQLDEMARSLIEIFAESDQSAVPSLPDAPGLFTYAGAPAMPAPATIVDGLAGSISINPNVDPDQGGLVTRLRDGGIADPLVANYIYNTSGGVGFSDRLEQMQDRLFAAQAFDPAAGLETSATLVKFTSSSAAWVEDVRKSSADEYEYRNTLMQRSSETLSKLTGINLDEEMTTMLELERSYQAASKLISSIDSMLAALLVAIG
ncbi:MAG TPA: flagellar hook-associated protein FlgK [Hyphomicrobiaceae bacterium]|nr:flagellar hook-associated protein FlgK [Hyphomicrobiaceae bacterium]